MESCTAGQRAAPSLDGQPATDIGAARDRPPAAAARNQVPLGQPATGSSQRRPQACRPGHRFRLAAVLRLQYRLAALRTFRRPGRAAPVDARPAGRRGRPGDCCPALPRCRETCPGGSAAGGVSPTLPESARRPRGPRQMFTVSSHPRRPRSARSRGRDRHLPAPPAAAAARSPGRPRVRCRSNRGDDCRRNCRGPRAGTPSA